MRQVHLLIFSTSTEHINNINSNEKAEQGSAQTDTALSVRGAGNAEVLFWNVLTQNVKERT